MKDITILDVDLAQSVLQLHGVSADVPRFDGTFSTAA